MAYFKVYLENGKVFVESSSAGAAIITTDNAVYPSTMQFPSRGYLTSTIVNTNKLRVVTATGNVVFNNIPYTDIKSRTGASLGASATLVNGTLNAIFDYDYDYESNIGEILKTLKYDKSNSEDRGLFYNDDKTTTDSFLSINTLAAKLQAGEKTNIGLEESSPGTIELNVASGSTGNEVETLGISVAGDTTGRINTDLYGIVSLKGWSTGTAGTLVWYQSSAAGTNTVSLSANASMSGSQSYIWPTSTGTTGNFLQLGNGGQLGWTAADNYASWNLKTNGIQRTTIQSGGTLDINAGTNITTSYGAGGVVTINTAAITDVLSDTTPQLGGNLDVNSYKIVSASNGDIDIEPNGTGDVLLGNFKFDADQTVGSGQDNYVLTYDNTSGKISLEASAGGSDTHLGNANLTADANRTYDQNGNDLIIDPNGGEFAINDSSGAPTGAEIQVSQGTVTLRSNSSGMTIQGLVYPDTDGTNGQVLTTNGTGTLSFTTVSSSSLADANQTLTATRTIDTNGNDLYIKNGAATLFAWSATSGTWTFFEEVLFRNNQGFTAGEIRLNEDPVNGANYISLRAPDSMSANLLLELPATDGTSGQALVTDGSGNLSFATVGGGSDTNIANANLTADTNRTLDMDGNTLTIDINDGGEFFVSDSANSDTYIQASSNVLQLGDTGMVVESDGVFQAKLGIEHDEANLTVAGAYGAGSEITYLGASATATTKGKIYYYNGTTWASYSSGTEASQKALLGIAIGTTMAGGFLLKGFVNPNGNTAFTTASPVYGYTDGTATTTAPTSGYQRVMGHSISTSVIFFNPSQEFIDLA